MKKIVWIRALKNLLHIPTWCYYFIVVASLVAICSNLYWLKNCGALDHITVQGVEYLQGSVEYVHWMGKMKNSLYLSGCIALFALAGSIMKIRSRRLSVK